MHVLIFANGDLDITDWVIPYIDDAEAVIAADGGVRHIMALSRLPDVVVGDMDSMAPDMKQHLLDQNTTIMRAHEDKDETDLELALLYAVRNYDLPVIVIAALGGRLDQMFANILLLMHPRLVGRDISFMTEYQRIWLINEQATIAGEPGDTVSLLPLGGDVLVKHSRGLRWPLVEETLLFGPARGVSNKMVAPVAHVTITTGHLLCVHTKQEWQR